MKDCTGRNRHHSFFLFGEKVLARHNSTEPVNRMNSRFQFRIRLGNADGVFRAIRRLEPQSRWNSVNGVPWRLADGRWTVDRPEVRVDAIPIPPLPFAGAPTHKARY